MRRTRFSGMLKAIHPEGVDFPQPIVSYRDMGNPTDSIDSSGNWFKNRRGSFIM